MSDPFLASAQPGHTGVPSNVVGVSRVPTQCLGLHFFLWIGVSEHNLDVPLGIQADPSVALSLLAIVDQAPLKCRGRRLASRHGRNSSTNLHEQSRRSPSPAHPQVESLVTHRITYHT